MPGAFGERRPALPPPPADRPDNPLQKRPPANRPAQPPARRPGFTPDPGQPRFGTNQRVQGRQNLSLQEQLALFDQQSRAFFDRSRQGFQEGLAIASGRAQRQQLSSLERSLGRRGLSFSGIGAAAEIAVRRTATETELTALANFDQQINNLIASKRMDVTLGHFDYLRQINLMELQFDLQRQLAEFEADLAGQFGWNDFFSTLGGIAGMGLGAWIGGPPGAAVGGSLGSRISGQVDSDLASTRRL